MCQIDVRLAGRRQVFLHAVEQFLQRFGQVSDAVEPDNGQGALRLMEIGSRKLDLRPIVLAGSGAGGIVEQSLFGALERQVDLAFDPSQRTNVEFVGHGIHSQMPISIKRSSANSFSTSSNRQRCPSRSV